jgi:o-succinylbenzoate synthase
VATAALLQGTCDEVLIDAKRFSAAGYKIFKLKVGDRNIPLDVKKVQDLRAIIGADSQLRLDGNRIWSLKEALIFAQLTGSRQIEFIEEPLSEMSRIEEFYRATHMPVALDETLGVLRCGITAPGRCSPTLANQDAVKAYVIKPMILGGIVAALDWIAEAKSTGKKAIISSAFESPVGLRTLANLASLTGQTAGLGTERWFKGIEPLINEQGIIASAFL